MSAAEAQRFIREVWGLQGAAYVVVGLRYYSRIQTLGWRKFSWDDALMGLAVVSTRSGTEPSRYWLTVLFQARVYGRVSSRLLRRRLLAGSSQQWHDRRATSGARSSIYGTQPTGQRVEDTCHRSVVVYDSSVVVEGLLDHLLLSPDVRMKLVNYL